MVSRRTRPLPRSCSGLTEVPWLSFRAIAKGWAFRNGRCSAACCFPRNRCRAHNSFLLFFERKKLDGAGEILDGEQLLVSFDHGDSDGVRSGIENIRAVTRRMHPAVVEPAGVHGLANILRNVTEPRPCVQRPRG